MKRFVFLSLLMFVWQAMSAQCTAPVITAIGPTTFCTGGSVTLSTPAVGNTWTPKANFGGVARERAVGFSIGNKGYIGTGGQSVSGPFYKDFWEYDPTTNAWTQKADFGGGERDAATGFSIGNKGYIGTGYNYATLKDFWEYNPANNTWTRKADFPGTGRLGATGFNISSSGYIGMGVNNSPSFTFLKDFWEYNPATNAWAKKTDFGGSARYLAPGFSIGSKGYVGTGYDDNNVQRDFWEYNPATNTWVQKADFGGSARYIATGFNIGNKGYIGFGFDGRGSFFKDFWEYHPVTNTWVQKADFSGSERWEATGFSIGSKGYVGTGQNYGGVYNDFWEFDPGNSYSWSPGGQTTSSITVSAAGNYSVTASNVQGCVATSAVTTVKVNPVVTPAVSISASSTTICSGTSLTFTATPTNGGTTPAYQWQKNGSTISGANGVTLITASLANNDVIRVVMTSNAACANPVTATSNSITMTIIENTGGVVYVDSSRASSGSGTSWASAYKELRDALKAARQCSNITSILVAKGTYKPTNDTNRDSTFTIYRGRLKIYGGYPSNGGIRNVAANPTILSGDIGAANDTSDNSYHVMVIAGIATTTDSVVVDGFTLRGGTGGGPTQYNYNGQNIWRHEGAGMMLWGNGSGVNIAVRNCSFNQNYCVAGGGIAHILSSANLMLGNCSFTGNKAVQSGGGIYNYGASADLNGCTFSDNYSTDEGGGLYQIYGSWLRVKNCQFLNNHSGSGGAIRLLYGDAKFISAGCVYAGNTSSINDAGALSLVMGNGTDTLVNNLFIRNVASGGANNGGGAIVQENGTSTYIFNNTFYADSAASNSGAIRFKDGGSNRYMYNNIFYKNYNGTINKDVSLASGTFITAESSNLYSTTNPVFVNEADADGADNIFGTADDGLQLGLGSPAVNTGSNAAVPAVIATDIAGASRIQNSTVDMGAYESPYSIYSIASSVTNTNICIGTTVPVTYISVGAYASGNTFTAQLSNAAGSFASPVTIGSVTATASGTINAIIPAGTAAGTAYRIRVVSSNPAIVGTDNTSNITINALPATPTVSVIQPACAMATGTITVNSPGGPGITYSINGLVYQANNVFSNVTPGSYNVTAKNSSGCISSSTPVTINAQPATPATPTVSITQPTCSTPTGTITVSSPVGTGITYSISGSVYQANNIFSNVAPGNYSVTAKNSSGCISTSTTAIVNSVPPSPAIPTVSVIQPTCTVATGTVTVNSPTGGGFTYSINGSVYQSGTTFNNVIPGNYNVTAKNSSGCVSAAATTDITAQPTDNQPPSIPAQLTVFLNANGQGNLTPASIASLITDNCAVNPNSITVSANNFTCANVNTSGPHQAYVANTSTGNQAFRGEIGMDFTVNNPNGIQINQLGAFDHQSNGITGTQSGGVRVAIFNKATQAIVQGLNVVISSSADPLVANYRMRNIPPVTLMPGNYVIVAKGYNAAELNGNVSFGGGPFAVGDNGSGAITYTNRISWGNDNPATSFVYPPFSTTASTNEYLAGSFNYAIGSAATVNSVTISASDMAGNNSSVNAIVTVVDTFYQIVTRNITVNLDASGHATIQPSDVLLSLKNNCGATITGSILQVSPSFFNCSNVSNGTAIDHQAYTSGTATGNQAYLGEIGMDFTVNNANGIQINQLGAFDHQGNGITGTQSGGVRVAIFNKATQTIVPGLDIVIVGNADGLVANHRMRNITPVTLLPGNYVVVAKGYHAAELNGNAGISGGPFAAGDHATGAITYTNRISWGANNSFPSLSYPANSQAGSTNEYHAGTFSYTTTPVPGTKVVLKATDVYGHVDSMTAMVTVEDPNHNCSSAPIVAGSLLTAKPAEQPEVVTEASKLNVYPNPSNGVFHVQLFGYSVPKVSIEVLDGNGKIVVQQAFVLSSKVPVLTVPFNLSNKASGMYLVRAVSATGVQTAKLLIQR